MFHNRMFAAEAGAKRVHGCEMSRTMYEMSHDIVAANHMAHQVQLIHKKSTDLVIGPDLPQKWERLYFSFEEITVVDGFD